MTIVSTGYKGTIDDAAWAHAAPQVDATYWVGGAGDFAPSVVSPSGRQVQVAGGVAGGWGIRDVSDGAVSATLPVLASGTRYDLLVLRRVWTPSTAPTGTTSVQVVSGTAVQTAALLTRLQSPGTSTGDDQPLAMFKTTTVGATTTVTLEADLRVWVGDGGAVALSNLVRSYLTAPGTQVRVGSIMWTRMVDATTGGPMWVSQDVGTRIIAGSKTVLTDAGGVADVVFDAPFPTGIISVTATLAPGVGVSDPHYASFALYGASSGSVARRPRPAGFTVRIFTPGEPAGAAGMYEVQFVAVGY